MQSSDRASFRQVHPEEVKLAVKNFIKKVPGLVKRHMDSKTYRVSKHSRFIKREKVLQRLCCRVLGLPK